MSATYFELVQRHIAVIGFALVAASLIYGRRHASHLIDAGIITRQEMDGFVKWTLRLFGAAAIAMWLLQGLAQNSNNPACLMRVPPAEPAAVGLWLLQAAFSAVLLWWVWARNGAEFLARVAPAFAPSTSNQSRYTPGRIRLATTTLVLFVPLWVIGVQVLVPMDRLCPAI